MAAPQLLRLRTSNAVDVVTWRQEDFQRTCQRFFARRWANDLKTGLRAGALESRLRWRCGSIVRCVSRAPSHCHEDCLGFRISRPVKYKTLGVLELHICHKHPKPQSHQEVPTSCLSTKCPALYVIISTFSQASQGNFVHMPVPVDSVEHIGRYVDGH